MKGQTNRHILAAHLRPRLRNGATDAERALLQHLRGRQLERCKFRRALKGRSEASSSVEGLEGVTPRTGIRDAPAT
jgi:hypothetical protein